MSIGRTIREARRRAGLSQRALASRAGVPQSTVGRIEAGHLTPRWETVDSLLRATGWRLELARTSGTGVDRSQIRTLLQLSPAERLRLAAEDAAGLAVLLRS